MKNEKNNNTIYHYYFWLGIVFIFVPVFLSAILFLMKGCFTKTCGVDLALTGLGILVMVCGIVFIIMARSVQNVEVKKEK